MIRDSPTTAVTPGRRRQPAVIVLAVMAVCVSAAVWWLYDRNRSRNPDRLQVLALAAIDRGDYATARSCIKTLTNLSDQSCRVQILQAKLDLRLGLWNAAVRELTIAEPCEQYKVQALVCLGEAFYQLGRHTECQQVLNTSLELDPMQSTARRWLAASYYDIGAMDLAMRELGILIAEIPDDARPYRLRGLIQKDFERYQAAIEDYVNALRLDTDASTREQILLELAECQVKQLQYMEAEQTLKLASESAESLVLQAQCAQAENQADRALSLVERALSVDSGNLKALLFQSKLLLDASDLQRACTALESAVAAWPGEFEPRYQLERTYRQLGRETEADAQLVEVERLQRLTEEFTQLHEEAFADTEDAALRFRLGEIAILFGKPKLAKSWFQAAVALDPDYAAARHALQQLGKTEQTDAKSSGGNPLSSPFAIPQGSR